MYRLGRLASVDLPAVSGYRAKSVNLYLTAGIFASGMAIFSYVFRDILVDSQRRPLRTIYKRVYGMEGPSDDRQSWFAAWLGIVGSAVIGVICLTLFVLQQAGLIS